MRANGSYPRHRTPRLNRRDILKLPLALGAAAALSHRVASGAGTDKAEIDEYAAGNIKLARRVPDDLSDDDMLFLKQVGLRWVRVNFAPERSSLEQLRGTQQR
ncbi:MAG: hypothetical protein WD733_06105, partial [Bryobacterales bacterium]